MSKINDPKDYEEKKKRLQDACALMEPDRIPIMISNGTWSFAYAKVKIADVLHDNRKMAEAALQFCEDIYTDTYFSAAVSAPLLIYEVLDPPHPLYGLTEDGYSFEHYQANEEFGGMLPEEYPEMTADLRKYILNVICPRRFPCLAEPYPVNYENMKKAYDAAMQYITSMAANGNYAKEKYGLPALGTGIAFAPLDYLFDYLRGFKGIMMDMRRRPEEVLGACEAIEAYEENLYLSTAKKGDFIQYPLHIAPFLGPKNFKKFYWPTFKKIIDTTIEKTGHAMMALEGDWTPYMDYLLEFPKGSLVGSVDQGDIFSIKKKYGSHMTLMGGLSCNVISFGTRDDCITLTRKLIDECGSGGGFIMTTDKVLQFANDLNVENYQAVTETLLNCGRK